MDFIENACLKFKSVISKASKSAEKLVGISRLKFIVAEINNKISKKFEELGRIIYINQRKGKHSSSEIASISSKIDELFFKREEVIKRISRIKNKIKCIQCNYENERDASFCAQCGNKLTKATESMTNESDLDEFSDSSLQKENNDYETEEDDQQIENENDTSQQ
ncbi:MAG: hypothetical protein LBT82_01420 [Oscillospiraceae bacterium]|jgi:hypothetical protein|nr:hypothetical protein [Oscillospiraceae bacterium]